MSRMTRILAVDDSRTSREMTAMALAHEDFAVALAANGIEALSMLENGPFDLIISDLNMDVMDGLELLSRVRSSSLHANVPVLILTTTESASAKQRARELKATGWLQKPIDPITLEQLVRSVCN